MLAIHKTTSVSTGWLHRNIGFLFLHCCVEVRTYNKKISHWCFCIKQHIMVRLNFRLTNVTVGKNHRKYDQRLTGCVKCLSTQKQSTIKRNKPSLCAYSKSNAGLSYFSEVRWPLSLIHYIQLNLTDELFNLFRLSFFVYHGKGRHMY